MMTGQKRLLSLYYSLTGLTELALKEVHSELEAAGHSVDARRITPVEEWKLPVDKKRFCINWAKTWTGQELTQPLVPMELDRNDYDYILLGFQPWNLAPSIPVNSFLESPMAEILRGKKVIGIVTCRARWERSYRIVKEKIARRGGELVDGLVIMSYEREPYNLFTTVHYLFEGRDIAPGTSAREFFRPYGIGKEGLEVAREFGWDLAQRITRDRVVPRASWRMANQPLGTY